MVAGGGVGHVGRTAFLRHWVPVGAIARTLPGDGGSAKGAEGVAGHIARGRQLKCRTCVCAGQCPCDDDCAWRYVAVDGCCYGCHDEVLSLDAGAGLQFEVLLGSVDFLLAAFADSRIGQFCLDLFEADILRVRHF